MRSMKKDGSLWNIFHLGLTKWKHRKWTSASIKNTRFWSQISTVTNTYSYAECQPSLQRQRWSAAVIDFWKKDFYQSGAFFITHCAGMVGNELWRSMRWMAFVWNSVQRFSFMAAIGTAARIVINAQGRCCARALWEEGKRFSRRVLNWLSVGSTKSKNVSRSVSHVKSIEKI